jgi:hypothetical protein
MTRTRSKEREQFLADIITGAVEGGTGYWAQVSQYQWVDTFSVRIGDAETADVKVVCGKRQGDEARATLHEMNDDETGYKDEGLDLTIDAVATGIGKIIRGEVSVHESYRKRIAEASRENDAGNIDAEDADIIAQAALLGEVVYG